MRIDGINLVQGSEAQNLVIDSGTSFPGSPDTGELFFRTATTIGFHVYDGSLWNRILTDLDSITTLLPDIITPGTYTSLTVNAKGLATAGTNPTTLAGYGITDAQGLDADLTAIGNLAGTSGLLRKTAANTWTLDTSTFLTANQTITLSGDITGSGTTAITTALSTTGVSAATYGSASQVGSFTVDAKGRLSGASNISIAIATSAVTSGTFADARIASSNVTQHQAALSIATTQLTGNTTVGTNVLTLTNPSAITFLRINADNTVTALSASAFRTAIGAGTSSTTGTVTSVDAGNGMTFTSITSTGSVTMGTPSSITAASTNSVSAGTHTHAYAPGGTTGQYIRGDGSVATFPTLVTDLDSLTDVVITSNTAGELIKWDGANWINNTLSEAGIAAAVHVHAASDITSGTFADARIASSNVTQHQASLSLTLSQLSNATTVGRNLAGLANPTAITFLRINADNTVSTLDAATFRTAIGAGTSSTTGTVTSVAAGNGMTFTSITGSGSVVMGTPSNITLASTNSVAAGTHAHAFVPGGTTGQYIRGDGSLATFPTVPTTLDSLTNVTITANSAGEILKWDGAAWVNNTLSEAGISAVGHVHAASDITSGTFADARIASTNVTQHQAALSITWGQITGTAPSLLVTEVYTVASQVAQLALTADEGDVAIRTDLSKSFIHNGGVAGTMADWSELISPTDGVFSFNTRSGDVTLTSSDVTTALTYTPWHAGNDGAASGLDADLLDGQHGAYYQDAANLNAGVLANARVQASNVTQHQASLSLTLSQLSNATTVGRNIAGLTNPSAITFLRINADNTVTALDASSFRTAIGAGTSSTTGTVTSVDAGNGMTFTSITGTGSVTMGTPGSTTLASTNAVAAGTHTHAFAPGGTTAQYIRGDGSLATYTTAFGTVTTVSVTTANGVSGSVATATSTPAITLTLGDITPSSVTVGGNVLGFRDIITTVQNGTYSFVLADAGKGYGKDNATAYTYTIPANSSVAFPIGTVITVFNNNATSNITIAITTDTLRLSGTATTGSRTLAPFGTCTLYKVASTTWMASGAGLT